MKSRSKVVALMAVFALTFALMAAIAPAALAGQSEVFFSDVNGTPKASWKIGETLYVTVVSHDENRDSDEVEFIDARSLCETHTGVPVPCVEVWDPNTKDSESNYGSLVLVETGINTGIFRSQTGIAILPFEEDPDHQENGTLQVYSGDTIAVRYQSPGDDTDVSLDLGKINATAGVIRITNQAGQTVPMWRIGQQVWITVEDEDANIDTLKPDTLKGVTLWNPRCVWDVLERGGAARSDQPEPEPCGAPVAYDSALKQIAAKQGISPNPFQDSLVLHETGPNTGVFRNVNGITLFDQLGPVREFRDVPTALALYVNHKDTIVAFYRHPTIVGQEIAPPPVEPEVQTDPCGVQTGLTCERTRPVQVAPGDTFKVTVSITPNQNMKALILREILPGGFSFQRVVQEESTFSPVAGHSAGTLRVFWDGNVQAGQAYKVTYEVTAGPTPGDFQLKGVVLGRDPKAAGVVLSDITVAAQAGGQAVRALQQENASVRIDLQAPSQANVGSTFDVTLNVSAKQQLGTGAARLDVGPNLQVDNKGTFFTQSGTELVGLMAGGLSAGASESFTATLRCPAQGTFTLNARASFQDVAAVTDSATVTCGEGGPPPPPPTGVTGFNRGWAGFNDPQDFALAQAKVGHANPANIKFTDANGNELAEFALGTEFFITLEDTDQNIDSDHVETLCVQVFNVNGGREGDTPGVFRQLQNLLKNDPRACREDHVRDLWMWKTGLKLVETGLNTGVFRNPNALKIIPICAMPEAENYPFDTDPMRTFNVQVHKGVANERQQQEFAGKILVADDPDFWWQEEGVLPGTVLKDCYPGTPYVKEGRMEFGDFLTDTGRAEFGDPFNPKQFTQDVPGLIAAHAGDTVYVVFQDQLVDPHDVVYGTAKVTDFQTFDGERNTLQFVDAEGRAVNSGQYKVGQDVFVRLEDQNRNVNSDVVDKLEILVLDRATGDWENLLLEETGADTGVFVNHAGLSLQPATSVGAVRINNDRLEVFDRDTIEAHYQDNFNAKDFTVAWVRLIPQPPGTVIRPPERVTVQFTDAQGRDVAEFAVGDTAYVSVEDPSAVGSVTVEVTNTRTGESVDVVASEVEPGVFRGSFTTGAPGTTGVDLVVADGDEVEASYKDVSDAVTFVTAEFVFTGARNFPNPLVTTTTFEAQGTGIAKITVNVYDLSGRLMAAVSANAKQVVWDGRTTAGASLSAGVYLYTVTAEGRQGETATSRVLKMVILR